MDVNDPAMMQAAELLEQHRYREALAAFAKLYEQCTDENEREAILEKMDEDIYPPIMEELQTNYEKNLGILKQYPYFRGTLREYEELPFQLFPANDKYNCFSKDGERLLGEYDAESTNRMRYFFEDLDKPLFVENEDNLYNLNFLNDNVRASEDYGADNHIYLFYDTPEPLERLMMVCDLEPILTQNKFVFLVGEENRKLYPLDFQKEFGTDYSACQPKELSVNDIKRIIWGWKIANFSGTSFLADIMDFHPDLLTIPDCVMSSFEKLYNGQLKGKTRSEAISFLKQLPDDDPQKYGIMLLVRYQYNKKVIDEPISQALRDEFERVSAEEFLTVLDQVLAEFPNPNAREWLIGIYLTYSRCHGRTFGRLIPALFMYTHDDYYYLSQHDREHIIFYFDLVESFPYHKGISIIRDPVTQCGCAINYMTKGSLRAKNERGVIQSDPFYVLAYYSSRPKDFYFPAQHPLRDSIRVIRFEDLKLNPKASLTVMAEFLNIPLTPSLFHTTWCGLTKEGVSSESTLFEGFDPAPVYKTYDEYLSEDDKYRIELLLLPLIESFGYRVRYYDGKRFSKEEIMEMMERPFLCESIETVFSTEAKRKYREDGMSFIKLTLSIRNAFDTLKSPFVFSVDGEIFSPLPWLRPKEELLERPLYPEQ